jgi:hypothetical protein
MYTADGHMSATISESKPDMFDENATMVDVMQPGYHETDKMLKRWTNYISYAGRFHVDEDDQCIQHHVVVSKFPNNAGHDLVRAYQFGTEDGTGIATLQLSATFPPQNHVLLWKRAGQQFGPVRRGRYVCFYPDTIINMLYNNPTVSLNSIYTPFNILFLSFVM